MRILIVHNTGAGFGSAAVFEFQRMLLESGDECVMRVCGNDFSMGEVLADAESFDIVVVSGGDGTVSSALYTLRYRNVPICLFPSGTANLVAANIGASFEPAALARACRTGVCAKLDLGEIVWTAEDGSTRTEGICLMGGCGYDARLMKSAVRNKARMGEAAYFAAALENVKPEVVQFDIEVDGQAIKRDAIGCIIANTATIQGDIDIVPDCRMDDGLLDVILLETDNATQLLKPIFAGLFDRSGRSLGRPHLESFKGSEIVVRASKPMPIEIDGEPDEGSTSVFAVRALPGAVSIIVDSMSPYYPAV